MTAGGCGWRKIILTRSMGSEMSLRDRIIVLEDSHHTGHFDKRTVFWDGAQKLTSIEVGFGGVWALCAPRMLFIPDRDGDLVLTRQLRIIEDRQSLRRGASHGAVREKFQDYGQQIRRAAVYEGLQRTPPSRGVGGVVGRLASTVISRPARA